MTALEYVKRAVPLLVLAAALGGAGSLEAAGAPDTLEVKVMSAGQDWRLVDADPEGTTGENTRMWEVSPRSVASLPVTQAQKDILNEAFADEGADLDPGNPMYVSQELLAAMESPDFPRGYERFIQEEAAFSAMATNGWGCSWNAKTREETWSFDEKLLDKKMPFSGGVEGQLSLDMPVTGKVKVLASYKVRKCFGIPIGFKFVSATASGDARIAGNGDLDAKVRVAAHWEKEWKLAEPKLGQVAFMVGPVPVRLKFTLPIYAGTSFDAVFAASMSARLDASASGAFRYTCTLSDCTGSSEFSDDFEFTGPNASASVDLNARAWARVMLRVALYTASFAYVEGGAEAYASARLWGYVGNACGDADGDGSNEWVEGLTADLGWGYRFAYGLGGWALPDKVKYKGGREYLLGWRDLLGPGGSTALQPMLIGSSSAALGVPVPYTVKMRPCYPYTQAVSFTMAPGAWTGALVVPVPGGATVQHTFTSPGSETLVATATTDSLGRNLRASTSRTITVAPPSLAAPSGLSAAALTPTSVRLDWTDNSNYETAFAVERRPLPYGTFALVVTAPAESRTAIDSTARPGTAYEYRVRASSGGTCSSYSNVAAVATPRVPPAAPSALVAQYLAASGIIRLTWRDNSADEEGFHVQYSYMGSGFMDPSPATVGANVTSYSSVAYPPSGLYWIRVRSFAGGLYSAWSNLAPVNVPADEDPPHKPVEPLDPK